jgi:LysM repeat protein
MRNRIQRNGIALLFAVLSTTACSLADSNTPAPTISGTIPMVPAITTSPNNLLSSGTQTLVVTPLFGTVASSSLATPTIDANLQPALPTATTANVAGGVAGTCTPRAGWTAYTVQQGDTAGILATQAGISLEDLVAANCLANADLITVGQVIYLPGNIGTPRPSVGSGATPGSGPTIERIWVEPAVVQNNGQYQVRVGSTVTLRAEGVANAAKVTFVLAPVGTNATPTTLGIDTNLADGVSVTWRVTDPNLRGNLWAVATSNSNENTQIDPIVVVAIS